jgi:TolB-like protein
MEYVEGQTLAAKINGHPLAVSEIVEIGSQIADALDEAHGKGITHRNIKPANVMLNERGRVKVLPLENLSGDPAQEYFAEGMTETLISNLMQVRALRVISRTSVMRFKRGSV